MSSIYHICSSRKTVCVINLVQPPSNCCRHTRVLPATCIASLLSLPQFLPVLAIIQISPPRWSSMGCLQPLHFGSSSGDALGFGFSVSASRHATQVRAPSMRQKLPTMGCSQWVHLKHSACHTLPGTEAWEPAVWSWRMYADAILNKYTQEGNHGSSQTRNTLTLSIHSTSTISTISQASPDKKLSQALLPLHSFTPSMFFLIFLERLEADHSQANGTTTNKKKHQLINSESSTSPVAGYRVWKSSCVCVDYVISYYLLFFLSM